MCRPRSVVARRILRFFPFIEIIGRKPRAAIILAFSIPGSVFVVHTVGLSLYLTKRFNRICLGYDNLYFARPP